MSIEIESMSYIIPIIKCFRFFNFFTIFVFIWGSLEFWSSDDIKRLGVSKIAKSISRHLWMAPKGFLEIVPYEKLFDKEVLEKNLLKNIAATYLI